VKSILTFATDYNNLGSTYSDKGEYDKAISYYEKALAIGRRFLGEEDPNLATLL
jgi:tetratricopeptide (TPR) repeat protein